MECRMGGAEAVAGFLFRAGDRLLGALRYNPPRHVPRIAQGGGGGLRGPQGNPSPKPKTSELGHYFLEGSHFTNEKEIGKKYEKNDLGPTQIATGELVTSKCEPHGLQRSSKGPFFSSSEVLCSYSYRSYAGPI